MENPVPKLNIPTSSGPFEQAEVTLSNFKAPLILSIPNNATLYPEGKVYAILGPDPEEPAWTGEVIDAGKWQEDTEAFKQLEDLKLEIPKTALEKFADQTTLLRYQTIGASSMQRSSEPISLTISK